MTLTKDQIANSVHAQLGFPKIKSFELIESALEIIKKTLESGENVLIYSENEIRRFIWGVVQEILALFPFYYNAVSGDWRSGSEGYSFAWDMMIWVLEAIISQIKCGYSYQLNSRLAFMKKMKCELCAKNKARRTWKIYQDKLICSSCCADLRNTACSGCRYFEAATQYHSSKVQESSHKRFIVAVNEVVERKVDSALGAYYYLFYYIMDGL